MKNLYSSLARLTGKPAAHCRIDASGRVTYQSCFDMTPEHAATVRKASDGSTTITTADGLETAFVTRTGEPLAVQAGGFVVTNPRWRRV